MGKYVLAWLLGVPVSVLALTASGCTVFERMFGAQHRLGATTTCAGAQCQVPVSVDENCEITAGHVDLKDNTTPVVNIVWHLAALYDLAPMPVILEEDDLNSMRWSVEMTIVSP